ncbi:hypothetical protein CB0940_03837 [Cercospora beticola]|uniref:C2H2-type domain-containing protein n=1 Tax=Cercospora beticola TaxID=122368 RepID=A0A2G5HKC7_CERBT|nr:hypothetical protein CB0940_03837 [Cercospora beticola]PIA93027.1 hypothetical protein CB0940_03837 [Cercospora beticola]WPB01034.1 hypothetical protein RHO25_005654 [Cercospora beticola]CAK1364231.1 unnamed protein product [Cercospora beticola]
MTTSQYLPHGVIAERIESCVTKFESTIKRHQDKSQQSCVTSLKNEQFRFKAWVSQAATDMPADQNGQAYSLRDTQGLRDQLLSLLQKLADSLDQAYDAAEVDNDQVSAAAGDKDDEDDISLDFEYDPAPNDLGSNQTRHIGDVVDQLYRLNLALRKPAGTDYLKSTEASAAFEYLHFDEEHVRQDFPSAPAFLIKRLAECISRRRQLLRHWQNNEPSHDHRTSDGPDSSVEDDESDFMGLGPSSEVAQTEASAVTISTLWRSAASISSRPRVDSAPVFSLKVPPIPQQQGQDRLRCPICSCNVSVTTEKQWRTHVFHDLQPYACTYELCTSPHRAYSSPREWQQHLISSHPISWRCPFDCDCVFTAVQDLEHHIVEHHKVTNDILTLKTISDACATPQEAASSPRCPLCQCICPSQRHWFKHVQAHQRQLALFSLPQHLLVAASDDESDSTGIEETRRTHPRIHFVDPGDMGIRNTKHILAGEAPELSSNDMGTEDSLTKAMEELQTTLHDDLKAGKVLDAIIPLTLELYSRRKKPRKQDQYEELESRYLKLLAATTTGRSREEQTAVVAKVAGKYGNLNSGDDLRHELGKELRKGTQNQNRTSQAQPSELSSGRIYQSIGEGSAGGRISRPISNDISQPASAKSKVESSMLETPRPNLSHDHEKYITAVSFCDTLGNWFRFPFAVVRDWAAMQRCILQASKGTGEDHEALVRDGKYSLVDSNGFVILPEFWSDNVWPGLVVHMQMWVQPRKSKKSKTASKKRSKNHKRNSSPDNKRVSEDSPTGDKYPEDEYIRAVSYQRDRGEPLRPSLRRAASANEYPPKPLGSIREEPPSNESRVSWADSTVSRERERERERERVHSESESSRSRSRSPPRTRHHSFHGPIPRPSGPTEPVEAFYGPHQNPFRHPPQPYVQDYDSDLDYRYDNLHRSSRRSSDYPVADGGYYNSEYNKRPLSPVPPPPRRSETDSGYGGSVRYPGSAPSSAVPSPHYTQLEDRRGRRRDTGPDRYAVEREVIGRR